MQIEPMSAILNMQISWFSEKFDEDRMNIDD